MTQIGNFKQFGCKGPTLQSVCDPKKLVKECVVIRRFFQTKQYFFNSFNMLSGFNSEDFPDFLDKPVFFAAQSSPRFLVKTVYFLIGAI